MVSKEKLIKRMEILEYLAQKSVEAFRAEKLEKASEWLEELVSDAQHSSDDLDRLMDEENEGV